MRPPQDAQKPIVTQVQDSLLGGTDLLEVISSKDDGKEQKKVESTSTEDPREDEFATKLTLVNQGGQNWQNITPDWSTNKKGNKSRILAFNMTGT